MRVAITGASGLIGSALTAELRRRGAHVTALSRNPERSAPQGADETARWSPLEEAAPAAALAGRDAIVHLAGEPIAQRWSAKAKLAIQQSRVLGTRHLIEGVAAADPRPAALICSSAVGIYGPRHEEPLDEDAPAGHGFLAETCIAWEQEARRAEDLGLRVARMRTGVVLDAHGGALAKMLPPFRMGVGGPIAGGRQYISWIHLHDLVRMMLIAIEHEAWSGAVNATAPAPVTNREFSRALGKALHRPAVLPVPGAALRLLYGEMAETITTGQRALPAKALVLGFEFRHPHVAEALEAALS